jgi:Concanavalin A-like lectin/glucanases superfamily
MRRRGSFDWPGNAEAFADRRRRLPRFPNALDALSGLSGLSGMVPFSPAQLSPSAYWPLQEASGNALDTSGNGLTLTANNAPGQTTGPGTGPLANARTFNGTNQNLSTAATFHLTNSFSLICWCNPGAADPQNLYSAAFGHNQGGLFFGPSGDTFALFRLDGTTGEVQTANILAANSWGFVAVTFNSLTNTLAISLNNGTQVTSTNAGSGGTQSFNVGSDNAGGGWWNGAVAGVGIFSYVLSPAQITQLYAYK